MSQGKGTGGQVRQQNRGPQPLSRQDAQKKAGDWMQSQGRKGGSVSRDAFDSTLETFLAAVAGAIQGAQLAIQKKHASTPPEVDLSREAAMLDGPMQALAAFQLQLQQDDQKDVAQIPAPAVPNTDPAAADTAPASGA